MKYVDPIEEAKSKLVKLEMDMVKKLKADENQILFYPYRHMIKASNALKEERGAGGSGASLQDINTSRQQDFPIDEVDEGAMTDDRFLRVSNWRKPPEKKPSSHVDLGDSPSHVHVASPSPPIYPYYSTNELEEQRSSRHQDPRIDLLSPMSSPSRKSQPSLSPDDRKRPISSHEHPPASAVIDDSTLNQLKIIKESLEAQVQTLNSEIEERFSKFQTAMRTSSPLRTSHKRCGFQSVSSPKIPREEETLAMAAVTTGGVIGTPPSTFKRSRRGREPPSKVTSSGGGNLTRELVAEVLNDGGVGDQSKFYMVHLEEEVEQQHKRLLELGLLQRNRRVDFTY